LPLYLGNKSHGYQLLTHGTRPFCWACLLQARDSCRVAKKHMSRDEHSASHPSWIRFCLLDHSWTRTKDEIRPRCCHAEMRLGVLHLSVYLLLCRPRQLGSIGRKERVLCIVAVKTVRMHQVIASVQAVGALYQDIVLFFTSWIPLCWPAVWILFCQVWAHHPDFIGHSGWVSD